MAGAARRVAHRVRAALRGEFRRSAVPGGGGGEAGPAPSGRRARTTRGLDARIVQLSREYSAAEVELARTALAFHQAEGARRLGYATEAQYARERLGLSPRASRPSSPSRGARSAACALRSSAARIGHEAALLISRVATAETAEAWVARARERTVKHLAEDVRAAELVRAVGGPADPAHGRDRTEAP